MKNFLKNISSDTAFGIYVMILAFSLLIVSIAYHHPGVDNPGPVCYTTYGELC